MGLACGRKYIARMNAPFCGTRVELVGDTRKPGNYHRYESTAFCFLTVPEIPANSDLALTYWLRKFR